MSEPANIRQAMDVAAATAKLALFIAVMSAGFYLWKHTRFYLGMICLWSAIGILGVLVYRVRKRKLKALDSN
jgi:hypothetical protein